MSKYFWQFVVVLNIRQSQYLYYLNKKTSSKMNFKTVVTLQASQLSKKTPWVCPLGTHKQSTVTASHKFLHLHLTLIIKTKTARKGNTHHRVSSPTVHKKIQNVFGTVWASELAPLRITLDTYLCKIELKFIILRPHMLFLLL